MIEELKTKIFSPSTVLLVKLELIRKLFAHSPEEGKAPPLQEA